MNALFWLLLSSLAQHQHCHFTSRPDSGSWEVTQPGHLTQSYQRGYSILHDVSSNTKVKKKEAEVGYSVLTIFSFQTNCYTWSCASQRVDKHSLLVGNGDFFKIFLHTCNHCFCLVNCLYLNAKMFSPLNFLPLPTQCGEVFLLSRWEVECFVGHLVSSQGQHTTVITSLTCPLKRGKVGELF